MERGLCEKDSKEDNEGLKRIADSAFNIKTTKVEAHLTWDPELSEAAWLICTTHHRDPRVCRKRQEQATELLPLGKHDIG